MRHWQRRACGTETTARRALAAARVWRTQAVVQHGTARAGECCGAGHDCGLCL